MFFKANFGAQMRQIVSVSIIIFWIILCPILSLFANPIGIQSSTNSNTTSNSIPIKQLLSPGYNHTLSFDQASLVDSDSDPDLFSAGLKYFLTPQYFILLACVGLLAHFSIFFKYKLPFCAFLAPISRYKYLSKRTLVI